jgi:hypothetical protein
MGRKSTAERFERTTANAIFLLRLPDLRDRYINRMDIDIVEPACRRGNSPNPN